MPHPNFRIHPSIRFGALALAFASLALPGCGSAGTSHADKSASGTSTDGRIAGSPAARSPATSELVAIGAGLMGPPGMKATVYAQGPPTVAAFAFDPQGRLWLTAAGLEAHTHDGVYLIAQAGAHAQRVISGLNDPLGLDWYARKLYVASVGRVDAYWGFNGTHFTGHRKILDGPLAEGENNLLVMAPNGRFLMGVSATCDHCVPTSKWDGAVVSFQPDGSDLRIYASRIRAPFGLTFYPGTSELFVTMNQQDNLGALTPGDTLGVVKEGQQWGFPTCYLQGGPACAGVPAPVAVLDKHAAIGGVSIATGQLGPSVGTSAIVAEWNVAKVQRVALTKAGSGYQGAVTPFLTGIRNPLAVGFAPDHSLLIGDWATGRIYRVVTRLH